MWTKLLEVMELMDLVKMKVEVSAKMNKINCQFLLILAAQLITSKPITS